MSNQEIVERAYEHFAAGEIPQVLDLLTEDVRWTESEGSFNGGTYTGGPAVLENVFARLGAEWEGFEPRPDAVVADGDQVVVRGWYTGTHRTTGRSFRARFVHWWTVRDGRLATFEQVCDTAVMGAALPSA